MLARCRETAIGARQRNDGGDGFRVGFFTLAAEPSCVIECGECLFCLPARPIVVHPAIPNRDVAEVARALLCKVKGNAILKSARR